MRNYRIGRECHPLLAVAVVAAVAFCFGSPAEAKKPRRAVPTARTHVEPNTPSTKVTTAAPSPSRSDQLQVTRTENAPTVATPARPTHAFIVGLASRSQASLSGPQLIGTGAELNVQYRLPPLGRFFCVFAAGEVLHLWLFDGARRAAGYAVAASLGVSATLERANNLLSVSVAPVLVYYRIQETEVSPQMLGIGARAELAYARSFAWGLLTATIGWRVVPGLTQGISHQLGLGLGYAWAI